MLSSRAAVLVAHPSATERHHYSRPPEKRWMSSGFTVANTVSPSRCRTRIWSADLVDAYWDHTQLRFPRREGMRMDFVLASPALAGR